MKKVLHIANVDGMIYCFRVELLKAIQQKGYEVHLCFTPKEKGYTEKLIEEGFIVHPVDMDRGINLTNAVKNIRIIKKLIKENNFEVIHTHSPTGALIGRIAAYLSGHKKIYYTCAGFYFHENMGSFKYKVHSVIERYLSKITDIIFFANREDMVTSEKLNIRAKSNLYCGPSGVVFKNYEGANKEECKQELIKEFNLDKETLIVGLVARVVLEKGYKEFIEVLSKLNQQKIKVFAICVGDGPMIGYLKDYAQSLEVSNIVFTGHRLDVPKIIKGFDVLLFPSYREGLPIVTLEAMASRTPVVAFSIRGCRESIVDNKTGYLVPFGDVEALFEKTLVLLQDSDKRREFGENGFIRVHENFTKEQHVERQIIYY